MRITNLFPILCLFLLGGCVPTMQIEQSGIINTRGVDLIEVEGEKMIETTIIPYLFDPNAKDISSLLSGRGHTIKQARQDAGKGSSFRLTPGKIRLELYGKEAAEAGILPFLNTLIRDARVSETMQLAVTDETAREILESEQEFISINTSQYLQDLLEKEIKKGSLPSNTLQYFAKMIEKIGLDPVLPILADGDKKPSLVGAALFRNDQYVERISLQESLLINMMLKRVKEAPLEASVPFDNFRDIVAHIQKDSSIDDETLIYIYLSIIRGKGKIKLIDKDSLHFKADIKIDAELLESSYPINIKTKEVSKHLEKDIEKYLLTEYENLFVKLQEVNADSFGLGQIYTSTREGSKTTHEEWFEKYPKVKLDFNLDFTIINFGTTD